KVKALAAGLPVVQPARLRDPEWPRHLAEFGADVAVVVAFGQILPPAVLRVPARGSINVHASLLPRYRGAAPIQWALIRGETVTGATTFLMDEGMDTGPILMSATTPIGSDETAGELAPRRRARWPPTRPASSSRPASAHSCPSRCNPRTAARWRGAIIFVVRASLPARCS